MSAATTEPQAHESFLVQQFFKNAAPKNFLIACGSLLTAISYYFKNSRSCDSNSARTAP